MELKTEYSSANFGVQVFVFSKACRSLLGVSGTEVGNAAEVGVCLGVGGWDLGTPELHGSDV